MLVELFLTGMMIDCDFFLSFFLRRLILISDASGLQILGLIVPNQKLWASSNLHSIVAADKNSTPNSEFLEPNIERARSVSHIIGIHTYFKQALGFHLMGFRLLNWRDMFIRNTAAQLFIRVLDDRSGCWVCQIATHHQHH